ncbi:MAG: hypothetical protein EXS29_00590 [Pedosphaera sp.]|nr:hypothetical protein [Pedosphaera sp.]
MIINSNPSALNSARVLAASNAALSKSLARLSSGSRIVSPEDDAAGLAVSTKFKSELARIGAVRVNVGNAVSFSQTQDGFLKSVDTALRRMSELATLATDQTKVATDVANYDKEFQELKAFIKSSSTKTFNGVSLFGTGNLLSTTAVTIGSGTTTSITIGSGTAALDTALSAFKTTASDASFVALKAAINLTALQLNQIGINNGAATVSTAVASGGLGVADTTHLVAFTAAKTYLQDAARLNKTYDTAAMADTLTNTQSAAQIQGLIDFATDTLAYTRAKFGGLKVTDASDATSYQMKGIDVNALKADMESATGSLTTLTIAAAAAMVTTISTHINTLAGNRAFVGANISRLNSVDSQMAIYNENLAAANSRIEDVDVAAESTNYAKQQILVQSGTAMLAQANVIPQNALKLIS